MSSVTVRRSTRAMAGTKGMSGRARVGMVWMLGATLVAKGGSFLAQIVLGWVLLDEEFGLYAIALSVTSFIQVLKDGGIRKVMIQRGERGFDRVCADVFWISALSNTVSAGALAALAVPASRVYESPELVPMLLVMALGTVLGTTDSVYSAALNARMQYKKLSHYQVWTALIRHASTVVLAVVGFGAMSLAWPWVVRAVSGTIIARALSGPVPLWRRPRLRVWPVLVCTTLWMTLGTGALTVIRLGPYAVIGLFVDRAVLGVYSFAFQLILQVNVLVAINLQSVLLPTLSALRNDPARHGRAVVRSCGPLVLAGSLGGMGLGVVADDLVRFIWDEKWAAAVPVVQVMALVFPFRMLQSVLDPSMMSRGKYAAWARIVGAQALVVLVGSIVAGWGFEQPWVFAAVVGGAFVVSITVAGAMMGRALGIGFLALVRSVLGVWACVAAICVAILLTRRTLGIEGDASRLVLAARGVATGVVFAAASVVALRVFAPGALSETLELVPSRPRLVAQRALRLGGTGSGSGSSPGADVEPRA